MTPADPSPPQSPASADSQSPFELGRPAPEDVRTVGLVGAGLIGASWAAYLLAQGLGVFASDPDPATPELLARAVAKVWPVMRQAGLCKPGAEPTAVTFCNLDTLCTRCEIILESGPEDLALKRALIARIDACAPAHVVIASCSSALLPSDYQVDAAHPERVLAAHPFNPPALVPLVEVAGGALTDASAVDWTVAFFNHIGKRAIRLRREAPGHVANRMASALYREAVDLVASGVASVEDVDAAIRYGPGLRWATMGPHLLYHLGGGDKGYRGYLDHLGPSQEARWRSLGASALGPELKDKLVEGVDAEIVSLGISDLDAYRDDALAAVLKGLATVVEGRV